MNLKKLLKREILSTYASADKLIDLVDENQLGWKPPTGSNWLTAGQLLHHMTDACGAPIKGFVTGDWGMPEGVDPSQLPPEEMLPPAEKFSTIESVAKAKEMLAADKKVALDMLAQCSENDLADKMVSAPWDPKERILGHQLLQMVDHLKYHKAQLFYYLKLQGKPVNTGNLWGY